MSFQAMKWAYEQTCYPDAQTKLLMLALANYAGHDNSCWPSIKRLARECLMAERTVQYKAQVLVELGLLKIEPRQDKEGDQTSNLYTILAPPGAPDAPPPVQGMHHPGAPHAPYPISTTSVPLTSRDVYKLKTVIEAKQQMADEIKYDHFLDVAGGGKWTDRKKRQQYLDLKEEIRQITRQIAKSS